MIEPRNTIICWIKACIDELVEKKMRSNIQVIQNDFKAVVEVFRNWWEIVENEIKQSKKSKDMQVVKFFETGWV